jgi:hypothetical protein
LSEIAELLDKGRDQKYASSVRTALSGDEKTIEKFLVSNTLWGGAESIADSALLGEGFVGFDRLATLRKRFTRLMADLGRLQLQDRKAKCPNINLA